MPTTLGECEYIETKAASLARSVTCDGGVAEKNPSDLGGMWAFRACDKDMKPVAQASGVVLPSEIGLPQVTNNLTEFLAVLIALEWLPAGWSGAVRTDSLNAIRVFTTKPDQPRDYLPAFLWGRSRAALARLGKLSWELLSGHPTKKDQAAMAAGAAALSKRGYPFCLHNVWADTACTQAWWDYLGEKERLRNE